MAHFSQLRSGLANRTVDDVSDYASFFFDGSTGDVWDAWISNGSIDFDMTNFHPDAPNSKARRFTSTAGGSSNMSQALSPSLDLSDKRGILEFYVPAGVINERSLPGNNHGLGQIAMFLYWPGGNESEVLYVTGNDRLDPGWHEVPVPFHRWTGPITAVNRILIQMNFTTGGVVVVYGRLRILPEPTIGELVVRFDDANDEHYEYALAAEANGFRCNFAVPWQSVDNGAANLTTEEVKAMSSAGHWMCNHCDNMSNHHEGTPHGWEFTDTDDDTQTPLSSRQTAIEGTRTGMIANGVPDWSDLVIVPGGRCNGGDQTDGSESDEQLIANGDAKMIWYAGVPGTGSLTPRVEYPGAHEWCFRGDWLLDAHSLADNKQYIDDLVAHKGKVCVYGHTLPLTGGEDKPGLDDWTALCVYIGDYITSGDLIVTGANGLVTSSAPKGSAATTKSGGALRLGLGI